MSDVLQEQSAQKVCINCIFYGWEQPDDRTTIQQFAKCKVVMYCSKQCQQEPWMNVHKQHCKYLSKTKIMPKSVHDKVTCPDCKFEAEAGWLEMCRPNNPVLVCPLVERSQILDGPSVSSDPGRPFPLGEMTGQFRTKVEATISLMMRILLKMKKTRHFAWAIDTQSIEKMCQILGQTREACWKKAYILANPGSRLDRALVIATNSGILEFDKLIQAAHSS